MSINSDFLLHALQAGMGKCDIFLVIFHLPIYACKMSSSSITSILRTSAVQSDDALLTSQRRN